MAVETQIVFDEAFNEQQAVLGVRRMRMETFEATVELGITIRKRAEFEIRVTPLNLGYRISRGYTEHADARVTLTVEQVPLVENVETE